MSAIIKKEFGTYFRSPVGYVFLAVYLFFSGLFFNAVLNGGRSSDFPQIYYSMFTIILLLLPLLTMRLLSEDKKLKTDQALFTAPISIFSVVFGKFIAALAVYSICVGVTGIYAVVLGVFVDPNYPLVIGNIVGAILFASAFISIGIFISSLTESQVIAAMGTFVISVIFIIMDIIPFSGSARYLDFLVKWVSFMSRYSPFTQGMLDFSSAIYFLSVTAVFLFFTVRVIERRRWN